MSTAEDLQLLRIMLRGHEARAEELRLQASEHGVQAVRISREIAELPCDLERIHDELIIHLGWFHKKTPPLGARTSMLIAIHQRILEGQTHV